MAEKDWSSLYEGEYKLSDPLILEADVVHGFKRGSKELGIPTANLNMEKLGEAGQSLNTGIYYGYAELRGNSYSAVVSIGWNPYYKNERKTVEAHLLVGLDDFYGENICVHLFGFLRPEANFTCLGEFDMIYFCFKKFSRYFYSIW
jgi:riboflavin kinase